MFTETTENNDLAATENTIVAYDGECRLCSALAQHCATIADKQSIQPKPFQDKSVKKQLGVSDISTISEVKMINPDGTIIGGVDVVIELLSRFWWGRPLTSIAKLPGIHFLLQGLYRLVAKNRYILFGRNKPTRYLGLVDYIFAVSTFIGVVYWLADVPKWLYMWGIAVCLYAEFKWLTWLKGFTFSNGFNKHALGYLFAWPGMRVAPFQQRNLKKPSLNVQGWRIAVTKLLLGAFLIWGIARVIMATYPFLAPWAGMIGFILMVHCGTFHLLTLLWQRLGIAVSPIMRSPLLSMSLSEFWGKRWNLAFRDLAHSFIFRPACKRYGPMQASLAVFLFSGIIHEIVISLPAGGGFGRPTLYFLLQFLGIQIERILITKRTGSRYRKWTGKIFTWIMVIAPLGLLAHQPFIQEVVLPLMQVVKALQ